MIGSTLGHYRIDACVGTGGMGVVYRAHDVRLNRPVAIKLLTGSGTPDEARRRILREARAASSLNHPNICTIHEIGEAESGPFIVMEFVAGSPLSALIPAGGLPIEDVVRYGVQLADALVHAHQHGVAHRDLKGLNVAVTSDKRVKILDFGLAARAATDFGDLTRSHETLDKTGSIAGTLAYMAPEILRGERAEVDADLWALGVLLYEMSAGELPFRGQTGFELTSAILRDPPAPLPPRVPASLRAVILRCLAKHPGQRHRSARELADRLEAIQAEQRGPLTSSRASTSQVRAIAVLPFRDLAGDPANAHLGLGLADATITELAAVRSLLVRPTAAILSYHDRLDTLAAGHDLGVDAVVAGTFQRAGSRLRVTVQLISTADGRSLWATKLNTSLDDIFELQDLVAREIVRALRVELTEGDARVAPAARPAAKAYELYMKGRLHLLRETIESVNAAIECFEQAANVDEGFAEAFAGLSDAYARMAFSFEPDGDWHSRAQQMCERALALNPRMPEGRYLRGRLLWCPAANFDHAGALGEFTAAAAGRPNLCEAYHWLGVVLLHVSMLDEGAARLNRALAINPEDEVALIHLGYCRYLEGNFAGALELSEAAARRSLSHWICYQTALAQIQLGLVDEARRTIDEALRRFPTTVLCYPLRGLLAAIDGNAARADEQIVLTIQHRRAYGHYHHAQYDIACIHALLDRRETAIDWLTQAARNGFPCHVFFERDPLLARVRGEPQFRALMTDLAAECQGYRLLYESCTAGSPLSGAMG